MDPKQDKALHGTNDVRTIDIPTLDNARLLAELRPMPTR